VESRLRYGLGIREALVSSADEDWEEKENLSALETIFNVANARGTDVRVVLLPNTDVFEQQRSQFAPVEEFCIDHQWPCLSLLNPFIATGVSPKSLRLNLLDGHPNEEYNALVARFLADRLTPIIQAQRDRRQLAVPADGSSPNGANVVAVDRRQLLLPVGDNYSCRS
jgi:hypothetical protein